MSLEQTLTDTLTQAIRAKDSRVADVVRMLKSRITERRTAKGFTGEVDDALVLDVIGAYRKSLQKALPDYEKAGRALMQDYRSGLLGRISLETPQSRTAMLAADRTPH